ncbi:MAG: DUF1097 domain-containing protein [Labilibaculum sp.]|nr:DUF1097 domain-containing protein [Labilibaculum sp.]
MSITKFAIIPLMIALLAGTIQIVDQVLHLQVEPVGNVGFGWIAFQAWAMYFMAGCDLKGGLKTLLGYIVGIAASIAIMVLGNYFSGMGFYAFPLAVFIVVIPVIFLEKVKWLDFIPAVFVGSGVFFAFMSYVPNANFIIATKTELIYCLLGLVFGYVTVSLRGAYESRVAKV